MAGSGMTADKNTIYYLPGRGGRLNKGLGEELLSRGYSLTGRELVGDFNKLRFGEQIELVANDLQTQFWHDEARVIANSFGAYLFLHAQTLIPSFPGRVLLLSPIVGGAKVPDSMQFFCPPRDGKLHELANACKYSKPKHIEVHVGELDWQSNPVSVTEFCTPLGIRTQIIPSVGHKLDQAYVQSILNLWL